MRQTAENRVSQNVRRLLEQYGWTQADLACVCGFDKTAICRTLAGRHSPTLRVVQCIADGLEVDIAELFKTMEA